MKKNSSTSKYHFRNLVFEGGGVKGIAYVGALEVLDKEGILRNIERVAGTSAGAMVAVLVGLGYTATEISDILWDINFKNFLDSSWGVVRNTKRLLEDYGWYKGDFFRDLMADYIKAKTGNGESTFDDLKKLREKGKACRDISLIGADLSTGYSKVFNATLTPHVKVADAARISMSIPLFFAAIKGIDGDDHIYVDGGLLDNYAVKVFDRMNYVSDEANIRRTEYYKKSTRSYRPTGQRQGASIPSTNTSITRRPWASASTHKRRSTSTLTQTPACRPRRSRVSSPIPRLSSPRSSTSKTTYTCTATTGNARSTSTRWVSKPPTSTSPIPRNKNWSIRAPLTPRPTLNGITTTKRRPTNKESFIQNQAIK